jgi:hypothetical protein
MVMVIAVIVHGDDDHRHHRGDGTSAIDDDGCVSAKYEDES